MMSHMEIATQRPLPMGKNSALGHKVIHIMLEGITLSDALKRADISTQTFAEILANDRVVASAYARAREIQADIEVDQALVIADNEPDAQKARNQIDIRKWRASKHKSRVYGERIDLNVQQTIDISSTLAAAKSRLLLPVADRVDDAQVKTLDSIGSPVLSPSDSQSDALIPNTAAPNIFD